MSKQVVKNIVTIGGGSGQYILLSGLRDMPKIKISSVVSMSDSGGSTGRLRDELGVLPPGDVLKCLLALSKQRNVYRDFLLKRFTGDGKLSGHSVGNMLLTFLSEYVNDFPSGVKALGEILDTKGEVFPVTISKISLVAQFDNGEEIIGESKIDIPNTLNRGQITDIQLRPIDSKEKIKIYKKAEVAIKNADLVILGPGDLYTSVVPNLLVPGMKQILSNVKGKIVYVLNIMTKAGETDAYSAKDFINTIEKYLGREVDFIIANSEKPDKKIMEFYKQEKASFVDSNELKIIYPKKLIQENLLNTGGDMARHDIERLAAAVHNLIQAI